MDKNVLSTSNLKLEYIVTEIYNNRNKDRVFFNILNSTVLPTYIVIYSEFTRNLPGICPEFARNLPGI